MAKRKCPSQRRKSDIYFAKKREREAKAARELAEHWGIVPEQRIAPEPAETTKPKAPLKAEPPTALHDAIARAYARSQGRSP